MIDTNKLPSALFDDSLEQEALARLFSDAAAVRRWGSQLSQVWTDEWSERTYEDIVSAVENRQPMPDVSSHLAPCADLDAAATRLRYLARCRNQFAAMPVTAQQELLSSGISGDALLSWLDQEASRVGRSDRGSSRGDSVDAEALLATLEAETVARRNARQANIDAGRPGIVGLSTGLANVDEALNGLTPGRLYVLAAPPGVGKTSLANQVAFAVAAAGVPVLYVTFADNDAAGMTMRQLCRMAEMAASEWENGRVDWTRLAPFANRFRQTVGSRLHYLEGNGKTTVSVLEAKAQSLKRVHGSKQCLVIVDYLQKVPVDDQNRSSDQVRERVGRISGELAKLAKDLHSPVLAISSVNRAAYGQTEDGRAVGTGGMAGLKESGDIEFDADVVLMLRRDPPRAKGATLPVAPHGGELVEVSVPKNRQGALGVLYLGFHPDKGAFVDLGKAAS